MDAMESRDPQKTVAVEEVAEHRRDTVLGEEEKTPAGEKSV